MADTRPCPYCGETIQSAAILCRFCKQRLDAPMPLGSRASAKSRAVSAERGKKKAEAIVSGQIPAALPGPGVISGATWASIIVTLLILIPGVVVSLVGNDKERGCLVASIVFGALVSIAILVNGIMDLMSVAPSKRYTPEAAVKAFYGAIKRRQYGRAWACLSPLERTPDPRNTRPIPTLSVDSRPFAFNPKKVFGKYWRAQAGMDDKFLGGFHKSLTYTVLGTEEVRPGVALVHLRLTVGGYPSWTVLMVCLALLIAVVLMMVMRKQESFEVSKLVYERDGLWWLANGEFDDGEDLAIAEAIRNPGAGPATGTDSASPAPAAPI